MSIVPFPSDRARATQEGQQAARSAIVDLEHGLADPGRLMADLMRLDDLAQRAYLLTLEKYIQE